MTRKPRRTKKPKRERAPELRIRQADLNRAIAEVTSAKAHITDVVDKLKTATKWAHHAAREIDETARELRQRSVLDREVEKAIDRLKTTFRDGPVVINESLIKLARDILNEQIHAVLRDQIDQIERLVQEIAQTVREGVQAEVSAAVRDAFEVNKKPAG